MTDKPKCERCQGRGFYTQFREYDDPQFPGYTIYEEWTVPCTCDQKTKIYTLYER